FTVPEELFGPLSLHDELRRKTKGYLPECDVAFIDEIFKANSSILNSLLVILNERRFDNGEQSLKVPLWCAVAASNELPVSSGLSAIDAEQGGLPNWLKAYAAGQMKALAASRMHKEEDSWELQRRAGTVDFPDELLVVIADLREFLAEEPNKHGPSRAEGEEGAEPRFEVSDRRLARSVRLLRIAAAAAGGRTVVEADLLLLRHMFWDRDPEQGQLVTEWLLRRLGESGDGKKAWSFLLEGLQTRLRHGARGPGLEAARRDLRNLQQAASRAMLRLAHISRNAPNGPAEEAPSTPGEVIHSAVWVNLRQMGERERERADDRLLEQAVTS
ncbi:ATPase RavA (Regulatory ATPase variant A), partial [Durusdinium trenchii]